MLDEKERWALFDQAGEMEHMKKENESQRNPHEEDMTKKEKLFHKENDFCCKGR